MKLKYLLHGIGIGLFTAGCISLIVFATAGRMSDEQIIKRARELGFVPQTEATSELVQLTSETPAKEADSKTGVITEDITPPGVKTSEDESGKTSEKTSEELKAEEEAKKKAEEEAAKKAEEEAKKKAEEEAAKKAEEEAKKKAEEEEAKKKAEEEAKEKAEEEAKKKAEEEAKQQQQQAKGETVTITIASGQFSESVSEACEKAGLVKSATEFDKYLCDNGYSGRLAVGEHKIAKGSSFEEIAKKLCEH